MDQIEEVLLSRRIAANSPIKCVAIVGGTHGNERHGVHMVRHYLTEPSKVQRDSFRTICLLGNPASVDNKGTGAGTRYVDEDLNRCFLGSSLYRSAAPASHSVEQLRARELDALLGPKNSMTPATDFIFDLHNTTSNTGTLLCFHPDDAFALRLAAHLHSVDRSIVMCMWPGGDRGLLPTVARGGMTVEIGPLPHSTVEVTSLRATMLLIQRALDFIHEHNLAVEEKKEKKETPMLSPDAKGLPLFKGVARVDYPRDHEGNIAGFIHPQLQGIPELQAGSVVREGDAVFAMMDGSTGVLSRAAAGLENVDWSKEVYPMFVNEAAYYEQGCAFCLAQKC